MKIGVIAIFCLLIKHATFSQEITLEGKRDAEKIVYRDSLHNLLTTKQALELLKTGKYVAVPVINSALQIEMIVRKPRKDDGNRYKTIAHEDTMLLTTGIDTKSDYSIGDSLPSFSIWSKLEERTQIEDMKNEFSLIMIRDESETTWRNILPHIELLIDDYPNVNYIICNGNQSKSAQSYFSTKFQKRHQNIYTASSTMFNGFQGAPWHVIINKKRKIELFVPPLPNETIAIQAIKKMLDRTNQ